MEVAATQESESMEVDHPPPPPPPSTEAEPWTNQQTPLPDGGGELSLPLQFLKEAHSHLGRSVSLHHMSIT